MLKIKTEKIKKKYFKDGYFIIRNFYKKKYIKKISSEIDNYKKLKCDCFFDRMGKIRRLERFYNKTHHLNLLNNKNEKLLELIFGEKYNIFKDKFNLKPPGGEGFNAHYDGIFYFKINKRSYPGWYTYASSFVNILIPFDNSYKKNGTIKIAKEDKKEFSELLKNTKKNGTPELKTAYKKKLKFRYLNLSVGDICIFSNRCAHKSDSNKTKHNRRILYYTYNKKSEGNFYKKYFVDKKKSQSKFKSLSGNL